MGLIHQEAHKQESMNGKSGVETEFEEIYTANSLFYSDESEKK